MNPLLTLPPVANLVLYLLLVTGMIAGALAIDRWLAVAQVHPAVWQQHASRPHPPMIIDPTASPAPSSSHTADLGAGPSPPGA